MEQDVFDNWQYVKKRHHKYGLRVPVPQDLQPILGKREITRTLGTSDPQEGKRLYGTILAEIQQLLDGAYREANQSDPAPLSIETAHALVEAHFREVIYLSEQEAYSVLNDRTDRDEMQISTALALQDYRTLGPQSATGLAEKILIDANFPTIGVRPRPRRLGQVGQTVRKAHIDRQSEGFTALLRASHQGLVESCERVLSILEGKRFDNKQSFFNFERNFIGQPPGSQTEQNNASYLSSCQ